jgi:hypothetical protein
MLRNPRLQPAMPREELQLATSACTTASSNNLPPKSSLQDSRPPMSLRSNMACRAIIDVFTCILARSLSASGVYWEIPISTIARSCDRRIVGTSTFTHLWFSHIGVFVCQARIMCSRLYGRCSRSMSDDYRGRHDTHCTCSTERVIEAATPHAKLPMMNKNFALELSPSLYLCDEMAALHRRGVPDQSLK